MITTVLADDHPIVRQGLRTLLEGEDGCVVVGEASDGLTAIDLIERLQPEIAILDVQMPDLDGLEVARRIRERASATRVIMLSMYDAEPFVREALRYGAAAYVLKGSATTDLIAAVHAVMMGKRYLSPALSEWVLNDYARRARDTHDALDRYELLTDREREVLQLGAQGLGNTEIGHRLSISPRTVETHRANLLRKLGIANQTGLVRFALERGLLLDRGERSPS